MFGEQLSPKKETKEVITEEQVIEMLKKDKEGRGRELFLKWLDEKQRKADEDPTSKGRQQLNIGIAELYLKAGLKEEAKQAFYDAANQANQECKYELRDELTEEAKKIK